MVLNYLTDVYVPHDLVVENLEFFPTEYLRVSYDSQKSSNYFPRLQ
jgi:hypothetical protein